MGGTILKHPPCGGRIWLIAGTGEGPPLAQQLLAGGWRLKVSLVSRAASLAYGPHPHQELAVGAIGASGGRRRGSPPNWSKPDAGASPTPG